MFREDLTCSKALESSGKCKMHSQVKIKRKTSQRNHYDFGIFEEEEKGPYDWSIVSDQRQL